MFRVPVNAETPSFDDVEHITFMQWFRSSAAERKEWARRRNAGAALARDNRKAAGKFVR